MRTETIIRAMLTAKWDHTHPIRIYIRRVPFVEKRIVQFEKFRRYLLRRDERQTAEIAALREAAKAAREYIKNCPTCNGTATVESGVSYYGVFELVSCPDCAPVRAALDAVTK